MDGYLRSYYSFDCCNTIACVSSGRRPPGAAAVVVGDPPAGAAWLLFFPLLVSACRLCLERLTDHVHYLLCFLFQLLKSMGPTGVTLLEPKHLLEGVSSMFVGSGFEWFTASRSVAVESYLARLLKDTSERTKIERERNRKKESGSRASVSKSSV